MNLRLQVLKGAQWTTIGMISTTALQLLKLAIIARFLAQEEFGLMATVMVVIGFSQPFADMGISNAIIQRQEISHIQLSSLYWLSIFSGIALTGIVVAIAPLVALFYEQPELQQLTIVSSFVFVITAIGQQFRILFQKELKFATIAVITIHAELISTGIGIYLAWRGYGVWALVISMLLAAALNSAAFLVLGMMRHHKPSLVYHHSQIKSFLTFGLYQMGERTINYVVANIDKFLIGKFMGMNALGVYNIAWQLIVLPLTKLNPIITSIAFPTYAIVQNDIRTLSRYYSASLRLIGLIVTPVFVYIFLYAHEIMLLVLGVGWEQSANLVKILVFVGFMWAIGNPAGALLLAIGRADIGFYWNFYVLLFKAPIIMLVVWKLPSIENVAIAILIISSLTTLFFHFLIRRVCGVEYKSIIITLFRIIIINLTSGFLVRIISQKYFSTNVFIEILQSVISFFVCYAAYILLFEKSFLISIAKRKSHN